MKKISLIILVVTVLFMGFSNQSLAFLINNQTSLLNKASIPESFLLLSYGIGLFVLGGITRRRLNTK